ncbi:SseB protein N-terminal domain-containing protein [Shimia gijangensis]|uniref:SseB protein N-terminal domain-containing protein n=1 Tax=Shimia gijangensis TaxID=1470563 RepID=A0A1M6FUC0_9RHOB|nr:SseB family protein [Shimia gijangensis]SHJ01219.1 SseB protein N-terminal domain-containing protein [Shimia gijangensis]
MSDLTPLDQAHALMDVNTEDDTTRLRFYERLADVELFVLLSKEAEGESISPELFELPEHAVVLVFDTEERLASFVGKPAPYAALSGRVIAAMLAGQNIGLGVNLEVAPSSVMVPPEALSWLAQTLTHAPDEVEARAQEFSTPAGLPEALITALDQKLSTAVGLAKCAYLVGVTYDDGAKSHLLGFVDAIPDAQSALAKAVSEALTFSGIEVGALDVGFFDAANPVSAQLARAGLRFDLPEPPTAAEYTPTVPGSDPDNPPKLR